MKTISEIFKPNGRRAALFFSLITLLKKHNRVSADGARVIGTSTSRARHKALHSILGKLYDDLGYQLENIKNLKSKHIKALTACWLEEELAPATISNYFSHLKTLAKWLGKPEIIGRLSDYYDDESVYKRTLATKNSKAWSDHGVNVVDKVIEIASYDKFVAIQLLLEVVFGLRKMEACVLKPYHAELQSYVVVRWGTKGGLSRLVLIKESIQREVLEVAKSLAESRSSSTIPSTYTYVQWDKHYQYIMKKAGLTKAQLGVTSHGLRHEYALSQYEKIIEMLAPIRQKKGQRVMPDKDIDSFARTQVANDLGHCREQIAGAYIGPKKFSDNK